MEEAPAQVVAVRFDAHGHAGFTQLRRAGQQQAVQMHRVFPIDLVGMANVLLDILELVHRVRHSPSKNRGIEGHVASRESLAAGVNVIATARLVRVETICGES